MGDSQRAQLMISREYATISLIVLLEHFKIKTNLPDDLGQQAEIMYRFLVRQTSFVDEEQ